MSINNILPKVCCPICGYNFGDEEDIQEINICPYEHTSTKEELITEDEDYAWVL